MKISTAQLRITEKQSIKYLCKCDTTRTASVRKAILKQLRKAIIIDTFFLEDISWE